MEKSEKAAADRSGDNPAVMPPGQAAAAFEGRVKRPGNHGRKSHSSGLADKLLLIIARMHSGEPTAAFPGNPCIQVKSPRRHLMLNPENCDRYRTSAGGNSRSGDSRELPSSAFGSKRRKPLRMGARERSSGGEPRRAGPCHSSARNSEAARRSRLIGEELYLKLFCL